MKKLMTVYVECRFYVEKNIVAENNEGDMGEGQKREFEKEVKKLVAPAFKKLRNEIPYKTGYEWDSGMHEM